MNLTTQEKKFADEYVFQFFHTDSTYSGMAVACADYVGYEIPKDELKADALGKSLLTKVEIQKYIDSEIERFRGILSSEQRRNLWGHISNFTVGTPENEVHYKNIFLH